MATLLHLDTSVLGDASVSRAVGAVFRAEWQAQHPGGTVIHRDLAAEPLPHLDGVAAGAAHAPADARTPEQAEAMRRREELAEEIERADVVVIGAPMYNFTIPSTLKSWIDHVMIGGRTFGEGSTVAGTPVVVIASRGGSYREGTPREGFEFVQNYLQKALGDAMGMSVEFIVPELTMARANPAMAALVEQADASRAQAESDASSRAKALAGGVLTA
jgi:FMN-dependent NADH-azoreductase